ncbi:MAG: polysaccharide deacetylase family protein [Brevundimonas sp.]
MRLWLIILTALFAVWLPKAPADLGAAAGDIEPPAALPTYATVLSIDPGRYGELQHRRTPLPPRTIALTFDDGPSPEGLPRVLDILDQRSIKATFFFVGVYAQLRPDLVREAASRGHNVACHSWSHPTTLPGWGAAAQESQVRRCFGALEAALADSPPEVRARLEPMFRFPGLNESRYLAGWLNQRGVLVLSAEGGTDDWRGIAAPTIVRRTVANMEAANGGVLILHETRPQMVAALPELLDTLTARGFGFVQITVGPDGRVKALAADDAVLTSD